MHFLYLISFFRKSCAFVE